MINGCAMELGCKHMSDIGSSNNITRFIHNFGLIVTCSPSGRDSVVMEGWRRCHGNMPKIG